jgi:vacuolar-type H+-ATPase subunit E/Vma4
MKALPDGADEALAPLRHRLAADAAEQADALITAAKAEADALLDAGRRTADSIRADAERSGVEAAADAARAHSAQARRRAHSRVLTAAAAVRERLRSEVMAAAAELPADPRYPALRARLVERGRALLGDDATVIDIADGGVVLTSGARRLDLSLRALAERAMAAQEQELETLWRV